MAGELTEEDVFNNDVDPLEGIRQLRKEADEPVSEELDEAAEYEATDTENETEDYDELEDADTVPKTELADAEDEEFEDDEPNQTKKTETSKESSKTPSEKVSDSPLDLNEKRKFKAHGQEFEFTVADMLNQFGTVFAQSMDYTKKTQKIAPYRKMISALEDQSITLDQLNVAIDALKGDKGAIRKLMDDNQIDSFDLSDTDESKPYQPTQYGQDEAILNLREIVSTIAKDPEYSTTSDIIQNQWDKFSQNELANNPKYLMGLHEDVKTGLFAKVAPEAMKLKILDGNTKSDIEYYMIAGQQFMERQRQAETAQDNVAKMNRKTQDAVQNAGKASSEANKKRSASSTGSRADRTVVDYLDDNDEAFDEWYKNLTSSQ